MAYKIYGDAEDLMLLITVDGWDVFGMTLTPVAPHSREWLAKHLDEKFEEAYERAARLAVRDHQHELRKLLGMKEPR